MSTAYDCSGQKHASKGVLLLTVAQLKKHQKAPPGSVVSLPFQHKHLEANMRHEGGFLPILAALLSPIISRVAGGLIEKEIAGSGLAPPPQPNILRCKRSVDEYHKPIAFHVSPDSPNGKGLFLRPWKGGHGQQFKSGHGLYLPPYPRVKGMGLTKLEMNRLSVSCRNFTTEQRKRLYHIL